MFDFIVVKSLVLVFVKFGEQIIYFVVQFDITTLEFHIVVYLGERIFTLRLIAYHGVGREVLFGVHVQYFVFYGGQTRVQEVERVLHQFELAGYLGEGSDWVGDHQWHFFARLDCLSSRECIPAVDLLSLKTVHRLPHHFTDLVQFDLLGSGCLLVVMRIYLVSCQLRLASVLTHVLLSVAFECIYVPAPQVDHGVISTSGEAPIGSLDNC